MPKGVFYVASFIFVAGAAYAAQVLLFYDFEGPNFPPEGWVTDGAPAAWTRGVEGNNNFARGYSERNVGATSAGLISPHFKLRSTGKYRVHFRYRAGFRGVGFGLCTVALRRGIPKAWERPLLSPDDWSVFNEMFDHFLMNEDLFLEFRFVIATPFRAAIWFYFDDLTLRECVLPVEAASLGRVKALYR